MTNFSVNVEKIVFYICVAAVLIVWASGGCKPMIVVNHNHFIQSEVSE